MASKQYSTEQAVAKLRQIDLLVGEGKSIHQACKEAGITDVSFACRIETSVRGMGATQFDC